MPLVKCLDCGTDVSDTAAVCPQCSRPEPGVPKDAESGKPVSQQNSQVNKTASKGLGGRLPMLIAGLFVVLLILAGIGYSRFQTDMDQSYNSCAENDGSSAICSCVIDAFADEIGLVRGSLSYAPLLRSFFEPSDAEIEIFGQNAAQQCGL